MIKARLRLDARGCLLAFEAFGHAETARKGEDIACAAFTVLARTAFGALGALPGVELAGEARARGELSFRTLRPAESYERAAGVADFLARGMTDLAREYPEAIAVTIERDLEE